MHYGTQTNFGVIAPSPISLHVILVVRYTPAQERLIRRLDTAVGVVSRGLIWAQQRFT